MHSFTFETMTRLAENIRHYGFGHAFIFCRFSNLRYCHDPVFIYNWSG